MDSMVFVIAGGVTSLGGVGVFAWWRLRGGGLAGRDQQSLPLAGTVLLAAGVLALVTGWLLDGEDVNRGEAVKTGGIAAGSVVALYALWLNDRRRRADEDRRDVERQRQDLEYRRAEHDRERVADERFATAIELLGNEADQVRVGAVAAMVAVARSRPEYYVQPVLDVLCAYLRRPFDHPRYGIHPRDWDRAAAEEAERELQVRLSAQRVIADLLPPTTSLPTTLISLVPPSSISG